MNQCHKSLQLPTNSCKIMLHFKYTFTNIADAKDNVIYLKNTNHCPFQRKMLGH